MRRDELRNEREANVELAWEKTEPAEWWEEEPAWMKRQGKEVKIDQLLAAAVMIVALAACGIMLAWRG